MNTYCIIDDEPIAHRIIEGYCENLPHLSKAGNCYDAFEAMQFLAKEKVDLIFLDINMPKLTGFNLLKSLKLPPKVIVTSAYKEYALEGYELDITDYLLKPFSFTRFLKAVNKAIDSEKEIKGISNTNQESKDGRFFLKGDKRHHQVSYSDILFIEAYGNYVKVYLRDEMIVTHETITSMESLLINYGFLRIHKSYMVAVNKIRSIQGNVMHLEEHRIPIGQTYRIKVNELLSRGI